MSSTEEAESSSKRATLKSAVVRRIAKRWISDKLNKGKLSDDHEADKNIRKTLELLKLDTTDDVLALLVDAKQREMFLKGLRHIARGEWIGSEGCAGEGLMCFIDVVPTNTDIVLVLYDDDPFRDDGNLKTDAMHSMVRLAQKRGIFQNDQDLLKITVQLLIARHVSMLFAVAVAAEHVSASAAREIMHELVHDAAMEIGNWGLEPLKLQERRAQASEAHKQKLPLHSQAPVKQQSVAEEVEQLAASSGSSST
jgi:hypothetical protein